VVLPVAGGPTITYHGISRRNLRPPSLRRFSSAITSANLAPTAATFSSPGLSGFSTTGCGDLGNEHAVGADRPALGDDQPDQPEDDQQRDDDDAHIFGRERRRRDRP
jgi:hypothetical protein